MIDSKVYVNDLCRALNSVADKQKLVNKKVFITGGTGLVGQPIVDLLVKLGSIVYVGARNEDKVKKLFADKVKYIYYDANEELAFDEHFDYIIHAASNAFPAAMVAQPVETLMANVSGLDKLLNYSKKHNVTRVLYISSSEVYGKKETIDAFKEDSYGYLDILSARSSYPSGKRAAETLCICYKEEYNQDVVIARLGHVYGPTASKTDNRVSSDFAYKAANGQDIIMKSDGSSIRSYMYCVDCASAVLTVLTKGENGQAYNIANSNSVVSIKQMAEIYAKEGNVKLLMQLPSDAERKAFNPMSNSSLDSTKLENLGFVSTFSVIEGFEHTIQILKYVVEKNKKLR